MTGQSPRLVMAGTDHRSSAVHERERLTCLPDAARAVLASARDVPGIREAMVLSTCNRTEFYLVVTRRDAVSRWITHVAGRAAPAALRRALQSSVRWDDDAVRHLLRVACGLESLLLGDANIAGQVRAAFTLASQARASGQQLSQLAQRVSGAVRRARTRTSIGFGASSHGAAVVSLVLARRGHHASGGPVLIVGAGAMARDVSASLAKSGVGPLRWVNRTPAAAARLAALHGGTAAAWTSLEAELTHADVVITAVGADTPIVTADLLRHRRERPPLIVDLGVPRNVAADVAATVLTIDQVRDQRDEVLALRRAAVPAVEAEIEDEVHAWRRWLAARPMERLIRQLFLDEARHRRALVSSLAERSGIEDTVVERLVRTSVRRLLHSHVMALRHGGTWSGAQSSGPGGRERQGELA